MNRQAQTWSPGDTIAIDFRKWPNRKHWQYVMEYLGEDQHARWLWAPAGTIAHRGDEGPIVLDSPRLKAISAGWWAANWSLEPGGSTSIYVDIIAPATWHSARVTMIDLDLDIQAQPDGQVTLVDEDEFLSNQIEFAYPRDLIEAASNAAHQLLASVARHEEPFGLVGNRWLAFALGRPNRPA